MSVPESRRGHGKFEVCVRANQLAIYTIQICSNKKVFTEQYQEAVTSDLIRLAKDIYIKVRTANGIYIKASADPKEVADAERQKAQERRRLQESAIADCNSLLALMDIAKRVFHLSSKRIRYWGALTIEVREYIQRWKDADRKRYAALLK